MKGLLLERKKGDGKLLKARRTSNESERNSFAEGEKNSFYNVDNCYNLKLEEHKG